VTQLLHRGIELPRSVGLQEKQEQQEEHRREVKDMARWFERQQRMEHHADDDADASQRPDHEHDRYRQFEQQGHGDDHVRQRR